MDYGRTVRISPSLHGRKSTTTPKFLGTANAYFVGPNFSDFVGLCLWVSVVRGAADCCLWFKTKWNYFTSRRDEKVFPLLAARERSCSTSRFIKNGSCSVKFYLLQSYFLFWGHVVVTRDYYYTNLLELLGNVLRIKKLD